MNQKCLTSILSLHLYACIQGNLFAYTAYFSNVTEDNVTVVNTTDNSITATIAGVVGAYDFAITPNGRFLYVSGLDNDIFVIDTSSNTVIDLISIFSPRQIAISPDGESLYVTNVSTNYVNVYSTSTNTFSSSILIGQYTEEIAINPAGTLAYIGGVSDRIYVVNLDTNSIITTTLNPNSINDMIFSNDGTKVYVASGTDSSTDPIYIYDTSNHTLLNSISVGNSPSSMTLTPNGEFLYVTNQLSQTVSKINTQTNFITTIDLAAGSGPEGIAITPDGNTLYTANYTSGNSSVINATNNTVTALVALASGLSDVIIAPLATPASLSGSQKINDFGVRYELYNSLNWTQSITPATIGYNIYRNGTLIDSTTGINETTYVDHNREEGVSYEYSVKSRASNGDLSYPATVTVHSR